jgi:hypothetical protein
MISIVIALTFGVHISIMLMYFSIVWQCLPFSVGCFLARANFQICIKPTVSILIVDLALIYMWFITQNPNTLYLCSLFSAVGIIACESIPQIRLDRFLGELSYPAYIIQFRYGVTAAFAWLGLCNYFSAWGFGGRIVDPHHGGTPHAGDAHQRRPLSPNGAAFEQKAS